VSKDIGISPRLSRSVSRTVSAPRRRSDFKRPLAVDDRVALQLLSAFKKVLPFQLLQLAARNLSVVYVIDVLHREVDFVGEPWISDSKHRGHKVVDDPDRL
jgi:hypothetical protein